MSRCMSLLRGYRRVPVAAPGSAGAVTGSAMTSGSRSASIRPASASIVGVSPRSCRSVTCTPSCLRNRALACVRNKESNPSAMKVALPSSSDGSSPLRSARIPRQLASDALSAGARRGHLDHHGPVRRGVGAAGHRSASAPGAPRRRPPETAWRYGRPAARDRRRVDPVPIAGERVGRQGDAAPGPPFTAGQSRSAPAAHASARARAPGARHPRPRPMRERGDDRGLGRASRGADAPTRRGSARGRSRCRTRSGRSASSTPTASMKRTVRVPGGPSRRDRRSHPRCTHAPVIVLTIGIAARPRVRPAT